MMVMMNFLEATREQLNFSFWFLLFYSFLSVARQDPVFFFFFVCVSGRVNMARFEVLLGHKMRFSGSHPTEKQAGAIFHFPLANAFQKS